MRYKKKLGRAKACWVFWFLTMFVYVIAIIFMVVGVGGLVTIPINVIEAVHLEAKTLS